MKSLVIIKMMNLGGKRGLAGRQASTVVSRA